MSLLKFFKNFFVCGLLGWCMECFWTGMNAIRTHKDKTLRCQTSVWMFPIYGMAVVIRPVYKVIKKLPALFRGGIYSLGIFSFEYLSGSLLKKHHMCPWDYSDAAANINGIIRLDYAPLWMLAGLLFERILCISDKVKS